MKSSFLPKYEPKIVRFLPCTVSHCTEARFFSFYSGGFISAIVVNILENAPLHIVSHNRAEILTFFGSCFGRNNDFTNSF